MTTKFVASKFEVTSASNHATVSHVEKMTTPEVVDFELYKPISERNIFNSKDVGTVVNTDEEGLVDNEVIPEGEAVASSLKVKLVSTFSVGDGTDSRSSAVVSAGGKEGEEVYTIGGKKTFSDVKLTKITNSRIEFINKGRLEFVELEDFASQVSLNVPPSNTDSPIIQRPDGDSSDRIEKKSENSFVVDRAEIDAALAQPEQLLTQIRGVPHFKEGRPNGLKLLSIKAGSIFSKLGLNRGDVLQKINGVEPDIKRGLEIFNQLRNENHITLEVERRGTVQSLEYDIR